MQMPEKQKRASGPDELDALEAGMRDDAAWELMEATNTKRSPLGAQVTIRLAPDQASRLRRVAEREGVGYTSLLREWIGQRLEAEDWVLAQRSKAEWAGEALTYTDLTSRKSSSDVQQTFARRTVVIEAA
jgi:predicted transcriptional regulator